MASEDLIQTVQNMLKEETWTRAAIGSYTQNQLKELADIVEKARKEDCENEILAICDEYITHSKDSIIALYISGILTLNKGALDNSSLVTLVDIFKKNHKEAIIVYLCETILDDDPRNKFALRTLAECYQAENNEKVWELYKTLVKIDFTEANLAKVLANHYESNGDTESAVDYYKKAILRFIGQGNYNACKEIWTKLVQLIPSEIDFFQLLRRKIIKSMGELKTTTLMQELYTWYKDNAKWDIAIEILKQNLGIEPKDNWARKEIVDCYRAKYEKHSHMEDYIRTSNLTQSYRNVFEAINDFEKHIAFDKGNFVFHRTWGVGIIRKLENDTLSIQFGKAIGIREISLKMAVETLKPLAKDHIWVLKATKNKAELQKMVKNDKTGILKIIIKSFDNNCDFKKIKAELVPSILEVKEWTSWNTSAKKILESDSAFGVNPNDITMYTVRDHEISIEEKLSNEFKAQKQFFARIDILMKYFNNDETDKTNDLFTEMYTYFTGFLKNITRVTEQVLAAYLVVRKIGSIDKQFAFPVKETFAEIYKKIENPRAIYNALKDTKNTTLREDFIICIKMLPDWDEQYVILFPTVLDINVINILLKEGYTESVHKLVKTSFESYKDYRDTVLFFFKDCQEEEWFKTSGVSYEKQLITLINIIELTFREINNHVNSTKNKKINKIATQLLFKDNTLYKYMFDNDENTVKKMYTLVDDIADIDTSYKILTRNKILEKYPNFAFHISEETSSLPRGMIVTSKKLVEKKAELDRITKIEIPENAKDISDARSHGDLKENAEYSAAKERQHDLSVKQAKLQEEINRATEFDPTTCTSAIVSFATVVTLSDIDEGKDLSYTILGPWESDPEKNVISYMTPLGNAIMDKKVGDTVVFSVNERTFNYKIKKIEKANI